MRFSGIRYTKASSCEQTDMDSSVLQVQLMNLYYIIRYSPRPIFFGVTFDLWKPGLTHLCLGWSGWSAWSGWSGLEIGLGWPHPLAKAPFKGSLQYFPGTKWGTSVYLNRSITPSGIIQPELTMENPWTPQFTQFRFRTFFFASLCPQKVGFSSSFDFTSQLKINWEFGLVFKNIGNHTKQCFMAKSMVSFRSSHSIGPSRKTSGFTEAVSKRPSPPVLRQGQRAPWCPMGWHLMKSMESPWKVHGKSMFFGKLVTEISTSFSTFF